MIKEKASFRNLYGIKNTTYRNTISYFPISDKTLKLKILTLSWGKILSVIYDNTVP